MKVCRARTARQATTKATTVCIWDFASLATATVTRMIATQRPACASTVATTLTVTTAKCACQDFTVMPLPAVAYQAVNRRHNAKTAMLMELLRAMLVAELATANQTSLELDVISVAKELSACPKRTSMDAASVSARVPPDLAPPELTSAMKFRSSWLTKKTLSL